MGAGIARIRGGRGRALLALLGCATALLTTGCGGAPPKPTPAIAALVAAPDVNPDNEGHASPIVVRVYELKEEGAFNNADYFALVDKEQETLGTSLVSREEYELQPGDMRTLELKVPPEARYLAVAAGYRDIRSAHWKALSPTPEKGLKDMVRKQKLTIRVERSAVSILLGK